MTKMIIIADKDFKIAITNVLRNIEKNMNITRKELEDIKNGTSKDENTKF